MITDNVLFIFDTAIQCIASLNFKRKRVSLILPYVREQTSRGLIKMPHHSGCR